MERKKEVKEVRAGSLRKGKKKTLDFSRVFNKTLNKNKNYYKNNFLTNNLWATSFQSTHLKIRSF